MKTIILTFVVLALIGVISFFGYSAYLDRDQTKNFSSGLGKEISVCGQTYDKKTPEYIRVDNWLNKNNDGWKNYFVTEPSDGILISGENVRLVFGDGWAVARNHDGGFISNANTLSINIQCK